MLALSGQENFVIKHFDAKTAFLIGESRETIYMKQPEGYEKAGEEEMVCRLKKGLYSRLDGGEKNQSLHEMYQGLRAELGGRIEEKVLIGYADADWAENRSDRKSNSGYVFKILNAAISWGCRKQTCIALSSTKAEYIALTEACQEALWIHRLLEDIVPKEELMILVYEDNQSCLKMVCNKKFRYRTKHVDTKFNFIKDLQEREIIQFQYCPTERMLADMLTKPLRRIKLKFMAQKCGLKIH